MWQLIGVLLVVGFIGAYWKWILLAGGVWLTVRAANRAAGRSRAATEARAAECAAIVARADAQHGQVLAGDERGTYGAAWPQVQGYRRACDSGVSSSR